MSVEARVIAMLEVTETLESGVDAAVLPRIRHDAFNQSLTLKSDSTPDAETVVSDSTALSGGTLTLDLTALTGSGGASYSASGKKLRAILFINAGAASMNVAPGASNPYPFLGTGNDVDIPAGGFFLAYLASDAVAVSGSAKTITITGTGTDALKYTLLFG